MIATEEDIASFLEMFPHRTREQAIFQIGLLRELEPSTPDDTAWVERFVAEHPEDNA